jgi:hypothetical protein
MRCEAKNKNHPTKEKWRLPLTSVTSHRNQTFQPVL